MVLELANTVAYPYASVAALLPSRLYVSNLRNVSFYKRDHCHWSEVEEVFKKWPNTCRTSKIVVCKIWIDKLIN